MQANAGCLELSGAEHKCAQHWSKVGPTREVSSPNYRTSDFGCIDAACSASVRLVEFGVPVFEDNSASAAANHWNRLSMFPMEVSTRTLFLRVFNDNSWKSDKKTYRDIFSVNLVLELVSNLKRPEISLRRGFVELWPHAYNFIVVKTSNAIRYHMFVYVWII